MHRTRTEGFYCLFTLQTEKGGFAPDRSGRCVYTMPHERSIGHVGAVGGRSSGVVTCPDYTLMRLVRQLKLEKMVPHDRSRFLLMLVRKQGGEVDSRLACRT